MTGSERPEAVGEGRCALRPHHVAPDATESARRGLERVRDPGFDPDEGHEWPADPRDTALPHAE